MDICLQSNDQGGVRTGGADRVWAVAKLESRVRRAPHLCLFRMVVGAPPRVLTGVWLTATTQSGLLSSLPGPGVFDAWLLLQRTEGICTAHEIAKGPFPEAKPTHRSGKGQGCKEAAAELS